MRLFRSRLADRTFLMEVEPAILLPADLDDYVTYWAFVNGYGRQVEVNLSRRLIEPGDTVIDAGAHIGLWILGAARRAGRAARVCAFEPVPETYEKLKANLVLNGLDFVECERLALSDRTGPATVYAASGGNSGMASLTRREGVDRPRETRLTTLDRFCAENSIDRVDFLKVDVEGAELAVFRGATRLLASPEAPAVLFEVGSAMAAAFGSSCAQVKTFLRDHGYGTFVLERRRLRPVPTEEEHQQIDLFAFKPTHFRRHSILRRLARTGSDGAAL